jgi:hypothetical protein
VRSRLENVIAETSADEVIVVTDTYEHADRLKSYELLAKVAATMKAGSRVNVVA